MKRLGPEENLLRQVVQLARLRGWLVYHQRPARTAHGWRTALMGHKGFPDLVLVCPGRLLFVELKSDTGRLSPEQEAWRDCLLAVGEEWYCWRPRDWKRIEEVLK